VLSSWSTSSVEEEVTSRGPGLRFLQLYVGLEVLRIINEPTATSLAYGFEKKNNETILVFNLGGGTFDVSVLEVGYGVFEVLSTFGDTHLGGDDFDKRVVDWLALSFKRDEGIDLLKDKQALQRLIETTEKAKMELSSLTQANISLPFITATADGPKHIETTLTRAKFEELCSDLLDRYMTFYLLECDTPYCVIDTKQQTSYIHKQSKKGAPVDGNSTHVKLKITIPRQPDLEIAHRTQRMRPKNGTERVEQVKTTASVFRAYSRSSIPATTEKEYAMVARVSSGVSVLAGGVCVINPKFDCKCIMLFGIIRGKWIIFYYTRESSFRRPKFVSDKKRGYFNSGALSPQLGTGGGKGRGRGDVPGKAWQQNGDWMCPNTRCGNINWAKRLKCNICNTNKPGHNEGGVRCFGLNE
ncbi:hypothetical protein IFM89_004847, partial [Coptis chinensis]